MNRRAPTIEQLCAQCANENAHTEHVAALALRLFDEMRVWLGLRPQDRRLLEAAARLHDIAYAADPEHHPDESAEIVLREGVKGFSAQQLPWIAAIIVLHARKLKSWSDHPLVAALNAPKPKWRKRPACGDGAVVDATVPAQAGRLRHFGDSGAALRLGALLRIADGMDYSHLQDASIASVRRRGNKVVVRLASGALPVNVARADEKADLWRAVAPLDIQFVPSADRLRQFGPRLDINVHPLEAARRQLMFQYRVLAANVEGAIEGRGPEPLHDIRVAVRRMRSVLRAFRGLVPTPPAAQLDDALATLNRSLGRSRDVDVWIEFLTSDTVAGAMSPEPDWRPFLNRQLALQEHRRIVVRRHLQSRRFIALRARLGRWLRTELPQFTHGRPQAGLRPLAAEALARSLRRIEKNERLRYSNRTEDLHQLRILLRRARYVGEFFGDVLGRPVARLTKLIHATERPLAEIHDIDTGLARFRRCGATAPRSLMKRLKHLRKEHLRTLGPTWKRFAKARYNRKIQSCLKNGR